MVGTENNVKLKQKSLKNILEIETRNMLKMELLTCIC